jgi:hypothetical protein
MTDRVGFLTMEKTDNRPKNSVGSSRIRARWLYDRWDGAEEYKIGKEYDVLIFQKVYWDLMMDEFKGIKILDLCDPDWLDGRDVFKYIAKADAVVTSTPALADAIQKLTTVPTVCIPDRVALEEHEPKHGKHIGKAKNAVWFGYSGNFKYATATLPFLKEKGLHLTIVADREVSLPDTDVDYTFVKYKYPNIHGIIAYSDMAILPETASVDFKGYFKSDNKTLQSWALGVPVVKLPPDLDRFMDGEEREKERLLRLDEIETKHDVRLSVMEYQKLINMIKNGERDLIEESFK